MDVFQRGDGKPSSISKRRFLASVHEPYMMEYFKTLDLTPDEVINPNLFDVFDRSGNGNVWHENFEARCVRLIGPAKAIDLATLAAEFQEQRNFSRTCHQRTEKALGSIAAQVSSLASSCNKKEIDLPSYELPAL